MNSVPSEELILRGKVTRVTFANEQNGYVVFKLESPTSSIPITAVGVAPQVRTGGSVVLRGTFVQHPKFGKQFKFYSLSEPPPETSIELVNFLSSGLVEGIGEKSAQRLVDKFGAETLDIICNSPERFSEVKGVSKRKLEALREVLSTQSAQRESLRFLAELGLGPAMSMRVYERLGARTIEVVRGNPYILASRDGIRGIGFLTADGMAKKLGIKPNSEYRMRAGLVYSLDRASDEGHIYLPKEMLLQRTQELLELSPQDDLTPALRSMLESEQLVECSEGIFSPDMLAAEREVAEWISNRVGQLEVPILEEQTVESLLEATERRAELTYSTEQRAAVLDATKFRLLLITGGPGCGKTTVIKALTTIFKEAGKRCALTAPTGRAAQRMSQVAAVPASTIHRLLKFDPSSGGFVHGANDPIPYDVVIVDETSMMDLMLTRDLLRALSSKCHLVLVGDRDQLPSVGPGRVFSELLSISGLQCRVLTRLYRRAEESLITTAAHQINSGIIPNLPTLSIPGQKDAYFIELSDPSTISATIADLVSREIPNRFNIEPRKISVLTPSNKGALGTKALNSHLQAVLNPSKEQDGLDELRVQVDEVFRSGDRVCQRVNNYTIDQYGVFNGDLGEIASIDRPRQQLMVELWDGRFVKYTGAELSQLSLAYAMTVHRAQGAEFPAVVLLIHEASYPLLERQLLYTAVTRAKKVLVVIGTKRALSIAVRKVSGARRMTMLTRHIQAMLKAKSK